MTKTARTVAVTGLGLMTGLGLDLDRSWRGVLERRTPTRRFTLFDPEDLGASYGVELPEGADDLFKREIRTRRRRQMTRGTMIAVVTAAMAIEDAGLGSSGIDPSRIGVVVGATGTGYVQPTEQVDHDRILRNMANAPAAWVSLIHKLKGPSFVVSTACSSGIYALATAYSLIEGGLCDVVIAGAADSSLNFLDVQGFASLLALSEGVDPPAVASRPFDRRRNGFVMGEGGGFLVLERPESARARGRRPYAHLHRPAITSEAFNIMSPARGGVGMAETMSKALELAGLEAGEIDYLNAHGTSTALNDRYETEAIKRVFGEHAAGLPVSSTKSMTGHCLAGAAGVEAVLCCKALQEGVIPPTVNLEEPDEGLDLDYVTDGPREARLRNVMCNSFAFGGHNGVAIFSRPE